MCIQRRGRIRLRRDGEALPYCMTSVPSASRSTAGRSCHAHDVCICMVAACGVRMVLSMAACCQPAARALELKAPPLR